MDKENIASIIIRRPYDTAIGVTNTDHYDIILLPQSTGVEDGARVITVYNGFWDTRYDAGGPNGDDSHDRFSLTLGKDDAYLAIGGNYIDNTAAYVLVTAYESVDSHSSKGYNDSVLPGPGVGALVLYDENGNPVETDYTYIVDANYNVHHLAFSVADKANGAIRFSGENGTLVLTAQNGAKNSSDYDESKYKNYYDLTVNLSELKDIKVGDYLYYRVDGGEYKRIRINNVSSITISGDSEINSDSTVEWFVGGTREVEVAGSAGTIKSNLPFGMGLPLNNYLGGRDTLNFFSILNLCSNEDYSSYITGEGYENYSDFISAADYVKVTIDGKSLNINIVNGKATFSVSAFEELGVDFGNVKKLEWSFVDVTDDALTDIYTIDDFQNCDIKEFSAEYRADQLRLDLTKFIADAGDYASYTIKYTFAKKDDNGNIVSSYTEEVALTADAYGKYIFAVEGAGNNAVLDYQVYGKNGSVKTQLGEKYTAVVEGGELQSDASCISAELKRSDTIIVDLTAYFKEEVTDFDKDGVTYTFGGARVVKNADGSYTAEVSGVVDGVEYKLERTASYWTGANDANGIKHSDNKTTLVQGYKYDDTNKVFKSDLCSVDKGENGDKYEINLTSYMAEKILKQWDDSPVINKVTYVVKNASGIEYTKVVNLVCKYSVNDKKWLYNGSADIAYDLAAGLNDGETVCGFDVETSRLWIKEDSDYKNRKLYTNDTLDARLNYYLGVTSNGNDYDEIYDGGWYTIKELIEGKPDKYCGFKITVHYKVTQKGEDGADTTVDVSRVYSYYEAPTAELVSEITAEIVLDLQLKSVAENGDEKIDWSKIEKFDIALYSSYGGIYGQEVGVLGSLHYADNEIAEIVQYFQGGTAVLDFTDIIKANGGDLQATHKVNVGGMQYDLAVEDGKFILNIPAADDLDFTLTIKGSDGQDKIIAGKLDNISGAGITDVSTELCKNQLYVDFNSYIKEFVAENRSNRDIDITNLSFNVQVGDTKKSFSVQDHAVFGVEVNDADEQKSIQITVEQDNVYRYDENVKVGVVKAGGEYSYDLSSLVETLMGSSAAYTYILYGKGAGEEEWIELAKVTGEGVRDWMLWTDTNSKLTADNVEFYIATAAPDDDRNVLAESGSVSIDRRVVCDQNGVIDFSAFCNYLNEQGNVLITDKNKGNIKYLVENVTTGVSSVVSYNELGNSSSVVGSAGDVLKVTIIEDNIVLKEGDAWQISGNDTSIVSIETALHTQNIQKTDDKIALRSDSYGIFGGDFSRGVADRLVYITPTVSWTLPGDTLNYTVWAENNLTVGSDLAGKIETNTNAINFGYKEQTKDGIKTHDDSNNRNVVGASVKAQNLVLSNNFRAEITAVNSAETMEIAQQYSGENVYDADGNLISLGEYDKTFRIGLGSEVTPCNGEYSKTTTFYATDKDGKKEVVDFKDVSGKIWVYDGTLYYYKDGAVTATPNVTVNGSYAMCVENRWDDAEWTFEASKQYIAKPHEKWVLKDGYWERQYGSFGTIKLEAGKDYEVGESTDAKKDLGYGVYCDWWERQVYKEEYDAEGNLQKVIYVYYISDDTSSSYGLGVLEETQKINGTWITAYAHGSNNASGNTIDDVGIDVAGTLSQSSGVWAGDIDVTTNDVYIAAHADYLAPSTAKQSRLADQADASNNKIGAYGVRVDGTMDIRKIDALAKDNDGTSSVTEYQNPRISAAVEGNTIQAHSVNDDKDVSDWASVENSKITAAAIYADTLKIDTITNRAEFTAVANNNQLIANLSGSAHKVSGAVIQAYGIYAKSATFRDFDGNIYVEQRGNSGATLAAGVYVTGTLTANCNFNGTIEVDSQQLIAAYGIYANTITVKGVIDTDINIVGMGGFAVNANKTLTAAGFTGESWSAVGINVTTAVSNVNKDFFDIAGEIYSSSVAFASFAAVNLRISGKIESDGFSVLAGMHFDVNSMKQVYNEVALKDYVELTGTANVTGDIDLRMGINNYSINSNATFVGNIIDSAGQANIVYHLEGTPEEGHITHTINSYDDQTIYSTNTITLNVNYAELNQNYQLIKYELSGNDAEQYWLNREVAVMYQGQTVAFKLSKVHEQEVPTGAGLIGECDVVEGEVKNVNVADVLDTNGFVIPETSGMQFGVKYYLLDGEGNRTGISGYTVTEFDYNGNRIFTLEGLAAGKYEYELVDDGEDHSYYTGSVTFKDKNGKDVTISGMFTADTNVFSVQLSGDADIAPEKPEISFKALAEGETVPKKTVIMKSAYDEKNDALTLSWNHQSVADYNLVEIYAYEVEYVVFDQNGNKIGETLSTRVVGGSSMVIDGIDENMSVEWRIRVLGSSSASMSSGWSDWYKDESADKLIGDEAKAAIEIEYVDGKLILTSTEACIINYDVFTDNDQVTAKRDVELVKGENGKYQLVIDDVKATDEFRYQVARKGEGWTALYSDSYHVADFANTSDRILLSFDYSGFSSKVIDANYNERANVGAIGSIANITFSGLEADVPLRNYIIEYCPITQQVTMDDVLKSGAVSIEEYIANYLEDLAGDNDIYTKTFTGTSLDISEIQNQTYVYWRIKAVDINGYESDWVAGETFRVWANAEGDKYAPVFNDMEYGVVGLSYNKAAENNFMNKTKLTGYIGWSKAEDADSGVKNYVIEFSDSKGETITKTVGAEYTKPATVGTYVISTNDYKEGDTFVVKFGDYVVDAKVSEVIDNLTGEVTGYMLTWYKTDVKYNGAVNIDKNGAVFKTDVANGENGYTATIYDYLFDFNGLTGSSYKYTLYAVDYFGNKSGVYEGSFSVDGGNPTNLSSTVRTVIEGEGVNKKVTCSIYWSEASDDNLELGIRYYTVRFREVGAVEWQEEIMIASGNENYIINSGLAGYIEGFNYKCDFEISSDEMKTYEYEVIAHDWFDNSTAASGKFGSVDIVAPTGFFRPDEFKCDIDAKYKMTTVDRVVTDEEGNTTIVTETVKGDIEYATVTLTWDGEFADQSDLRYVVEISDSEFFDSKNTYSFWTESSAESMVFNNSTPGRPVSIFEGMSKVYWRVTVADEYFNTSVVGGTQSFTFVDDTGKAISNSKKPAAPSNLVIVNNEMVDGVFTGKNISLSWRSESELLGVYSYTITLMDSKTKKVVATFNTADKSSFQATDINSIVSVKNNGSYSVMTIADLNKIFSSGDKLADGSYTVKVVAVDGKGKVSDAGEVVFTQDTTAPTFDASKINKYLLPGGTDALGNSVAKFIIDWTDAVKKTGSKDIVRYEIWQKSGDGESDKWMKVADTVTTTYEAQLPVNNPDTYSYKVVAYDAAGNKSSESMWNDNTILNFTPSNAKDGYLNDFAPATLLKFEDGRSVMPDKDVELVGNGDVDCVYFATAGSSEALTLTVDTLNTVYGAATGIKVEVYKGSTTSLWKTFTVNSAGRVFTDLLLDGNNTTYYFKVYTVKSASVAEYNMVWDKAVLGGEFFKSEDNFEAPAYSLSVGADGCTMVDWVGYGDTVDFRKLEITQSGKYNITLSDVASSVVITLIEKGVNGAKDKNVASVTAKQSDLNGKTISNVQLEANKEYYIKVTSSTANSIGTGYHVSIDQVAGFAEPTVEDDTMGSVELVNGTTGWVGWGDSVDYYYVDASDMVADGYYTLVLSGTNGNQIKAAVGYKDAKGAFVAIQTVTGAANSTNLMLSRKFTDADLKKLAIDADADGNPDNTLVIKVFTANATSNSDYTVSWGKNDIDNSDDALSKGVAFSTYDGIQAGIAKTGEWVGLGDAVDYFRVDGTNGFCCFELSGAENNLALNLYEVKLDADGKVVSSTKVSSANATTAADGKIYWALDASKEYAVSVNCSSATQGLNSSYQLELNNLSDFTNAIGVAVSAIEPVAYSLKVGADDAKLRSFELSNLAGGQVKVSIYDAATNKLVKSFTSVAGADFMSFSYNFAEGNYMIKVEAADKNGLDKTFDIVCRENLADIADDVIVGKAKKSGWVNSIATADGEVDGWVGLNDASDFIQLDLSNGTGIYNINVNGFDNKVTVALLEVTAWNNDGTVKTTKTIQSINGTAAADALFKDMVLDASKTYFVQVKAAATTGAGDSNYGISLEKVYGLDIASDDNIVDKARKLTVNSESAEAGAVWLLSDKSGDTVDYYVITVDEAGNYSFVLDGINGNSIKISVGTKDAKGAFKSLQSVTGAAGANELILSRNLAAGEYLVKVENAGSGKSSSYELTATHNDSLDGFDTGDNTWQLVAGDVDCKVFDAGDCITDWVGFGDAIDVFKIRFNADDIAENGQLVFSAKDDDAETASALISKKITLALVDANGKAVTLNFDKVSGDYISKDILMAGVDYYLTVKDSDDKKYNVDYNIEIGLA